MLMSCKTCTHLGFDRDMRCPACNLGVENFGEKFGLNLVGSRDIYDFIPELRNGEVVEISGRFFFVQPKDEFDDDLTKMPKSISDGIDQLELEANNLLGEEPVGLLSENPMIERVSTPGEWSRKMLQEEATSYRRDPDAEPDPEEMLARPSRGNRFGFRYTFLGFNVVDAFIEPYLWDNCCDRGEHKWTKQSFNTTVMSQKMDTVDTKSISYRFGKALWAEKWLRNFEGKLPTKCPSCGAPAVEDELCDWCSANEEFILGYVAHADKIIRSRNNATVLNTFDSVEEVVHSFGEALPLANEYYATIDALRS